MGRFSRNPIPRRQPRRHRAHCDIEIDADFVGTTPSVITLTPGKHQLTVTKTNDQLWTHTIPFTAATIHLNAEMFTN